MNSSYYSESDFMDFQNTSPILHFYSPLFVMLPGLVLSCVNAYIFSSKPFRQTNMGFLSIAQAISETFSLSIGLAYYFLLNFGFDFQQNNHIFCNFLNYIRRFTLKMCSWFQVLIAMDRVLNFKYKYRINWFKSRKYILILIFCMLGTLAVVFLADAFYYYSKTEIYIENNKTLVKYYCKSKFVPALVSDVVSAVFRTIIPFGIMLGTSIIMIKEIRLSKKLVLSKVGRREKQFTFTVLMINILFLVTQIPLSLVQLIQNFLRYFLNASFDILSYVDFLASIGFMIVYFSQSAQFFYYVLFNKLFRRRVKNFFRNNYTKKVLK